jgi:hypothetical protein
MFPIINMTNRFNLNTLDLKQCGDGLIDSIFVVLHSKDTKNHSKITS